MRKFGPATSESIQWIDGSKSNNVPDSGSSGGWKIAFIITLVFSCLAIAVAAYLFLRPGEAEKNPYFAAARINLLDTEVQQPTPTEVTNELPPTYASDS